MSRTAIYERYIAGRESEFVYPVVERTPALLVAEGKSEEHTSEVEH